MMLMHHLRFLHGTWFTGSETIESMHHCHGLRHTDPDPPYDVEHTHEPYGRQS